MSWFQIQKWLDKNKNFEFQIIAIMNFYLEGGEELFIGEVGYLRNQKWFSNQQPPLSALPPSKKDSLKGHLLTRNTTQNKKNNFSAPRKHQIKKKQRKSKVKTWFNIFWKNKLYIYIYLGVIFIYINEIFCQYCIIIICIYFLVSDCLYSHLDPYLVCQKDFKGLNYVICQSGL